MSLNFNPGPYEQLFLQRQKMQQDNRQRPFDALAQMAQTSGQMADRAQKGRQDQALLAMKQREEGRQQGEYNANYNPPTFPIAQAPQLGQNAMSEVPEGPMRNPSPMFTQLPGQTPRPMFSNLRAEPTNANEWASAVQADPRAGIKFRDQAIDIQKNRAADTSDYATPEQINSWNPKIDPTEIRKAFPSGRVPRWMAENYKAPGSGDQQFNNEQDRLEQHAMQGIQSLRGDKSLADSELKRDAAITVYNTAKQLKQEGRMPSKLEYYDLLGQMWKARTGASPTDQSIKDLDSSTFKGDIGKAYTYMTGKPAAATTEAVLQNIQDFAAASGKQADQFHEGYMKTHLIKPKGLEEDRWTPIAQTGRGHSFVDATGYQEQPQMVTIKDSQGGMHSLPAQSLDAAKRRDPGLQVVE